MKTGVALDSTDRGRRITITRRVDAPAEDAWEVLTDTEQWHEWGPPVTGVDYPGTTVSPDTEGRVQAFGFLWVPFRIIKADDYLWIWKAWGLTPPADGHRVEKLDDDTCQVTLELPLWAPWYILLCWFALRKVARIVEHNG